MFVEDKTRTFGGPIWEVICFFCITRCGSETEILWIWRETISKRTTRTFCPTLYYLNTRYHFYSCWSLLCANYQRFDLLDKMSIDECLLWSHLPSDGNLSTSPNNSRQHSFLLPFHWIWTSIFLRSERRTKIHFERRITDFWHICCILGATTSMQSWLTQVAFRMDLSDMHGTHDNGIWRITLHPVIMEAWRCNYRISPSSYRSEVVDKDGYYFNKLSFWS